MKKKPIDRLRELADAEKMSRRAIDWLEELDLGELEELGSHLTDLSFAVAAARENVEAWAESDGADRVECREAALDSLVEFMQAWDAVDMLDVTEGTKALIADAGWPDDDDESTS